MILLQFTKFSKQINGTEFTIGTTTTRILFIVLVLAKIYFEIKRFKLDKVLAAWNTIMASAARQPI